MRLSIVTRFNSQLGLCSALCLCACSAADDHVGKPGSGGGGSDPSGTKVEDSGGQSPGVAGGASATNGLGAAGGVALTTLLSQAGSVAAASSAGSSSLASVGGSSSGTTALQAYAGASAAGGLSGQGGGASTEVLPAELVGVWQQTRASSGDYVSASGTTFTLTSGLSVQLKLSRNGTYYLANLGSGVAQTCGAVSNFEQSVGYATLVGDSLVFAPTQHILEVNDCDGRRVLDLGGAPFSLAIALEEAQHLSGGIRTYRMLATGGPHPYDLMLLHRPPLGNPPVQAQPADFTLGADGPYQDFQGLWVAAAGTDSDFFSPNTGQ
ncbi:MAG TPA: hypothetical protein VKP30_25630 [Polyangiaceae bacterium]|nr:hypothetical protein [Polyangiaceae bacterium]